MEPPNENQFSRYYQQQQQHLHHNHHSAAAVLPAINGLLPNPHSSPEGPHVVYPRSVPSAVSTQLDSAKRKRGRPRKYGTPELALAAKKAASSLTKERREHQLGSALGGGASASASSFSSKKPQLGALGQGFTPHVIHVAAGEDVSQKVLLFMQQNKHEICVLSASGSISNPSLRQPATSGGNITFEGRFEIISLSGSYIHNEVGRRSGGLSVCLSSTDGQIVGGVVAGTLTAAGPVQIILGTFLMDTTEVGAATEGDTSVGKSSSAIEGALMSSLGFRSIESAGVNQIRVEDDDQTIGGSHFMIEPQGMHMTPQLTDWRRGLDGRGNSSYDFAGRMGYGAQQSPENGVL